MDTTDSECFDVEFAIDAIAVYTDSNTPNLVTAYAKLSRKYI